MDLLALVLPDSLIVIFSDIHTFGNVVIKRQKHGLTGHGNR